MIDQYVTLEGLFIVLKTHEGRDTFITHNSGFDTVKTPLGMFENEIDNDLLMVDDVIREYYGMTGGTDAGTGCL